MSRWDYDTVFYRVFCITLLAVAFTFTVILTNVFVDIDGLLSKKDKVKPDIFQPVTQATPEERVDALPRDTAKSEDVYEDKYYDDSSDLYRSKRSLASKESYHLKDSKVKKLLTSHLATLLKDLDKEIESTHSHTDKNDKEIDRDDVKKNAKVEQTQQLERQNRIDKVKYHRELDAYNKSGDRIVLHKETRSVVEAKVTEDQEKTTKTNAITKVETTTVQNEFYMKEDVLHLAMHNIILQGLTRHMDLNDVYKRVHALEKIAKNEQSEIVKGKSNPLIAEPRSQDELRNRELESKFFDELVNCGQLKSEVEFRNRSDGIDNGQNKLTTSDPKDHNVLIKTVIDITALGNDRSNKENTKLKDNLNGVVKLIYNGQPIKFKRAEDDDSVTSKAVAYTDVESRGEVLNSFLTQSYLQNLYFNKLLKDYLQVQSKDADINDNDSENDYTTKRKKRNVKIRFDNYHTTFKPEKMKNDDELFVEIETNVDSNSVNGERKRKLVKELITKIQNAIHSGESKKKKHKHLHVKKRNQNPLNHKIANDFLKQIKNLVHRELDPISKVSLNGNIPTITGYNGDIQLKQDYLGPGFFYKAINSAETTDVETDYDKIVSNSMSQRLLQPINTEVNAEKIPLAFDQENIKLLVRDIDGTGFTIGFNQYIDEPPDAETMKLFTGLENIIKEYHQNYDDPETQSGNDEHIVNENSNTNEANRESDKKKPHVITRRSVTSKDHDYHSNEYKIIFNNNFLPYNNYQDIYTDKARNSKKLKKKRKMNPANPLVIDENIFERNLKPGEILSIANLFGRQKRYVNVKKISNVRFTKKKMYSTTKPNKSHKLFLNNHRNKRDIDKIRIIARDMPSLRRNSDEDIFLVSDEKVLADRAVIKDIETPMFQNTDRMNTEEDQHYDISPPQQAAENHYDVIEPQKLDNEPFNVMSPYGYEPANERQYEDHFTRKSRRNSLMSKYPHIFMEEISRAKDGIQYPDDMLSYTKLTENFPYKTITINNTKPPVIVQSDIPDFNGLINPQDDNSNYKVTVKIMPKNTSNAKSGFKEVHTSINKSFKKNGLLYTSLVNVSEVSKVENMNKNNKSASVENYEVSNIKQQQGAIKALIEQHKNRIEQQLQLLNKEKEKLSTMTVDIEITTIPPATPPSTISELVDVVLPSNPSKILRLTKQDIGKLFETTFKAKATSTTEPSTSTVLTEPTVITTTHYISPTTANTENIKILQTIEKNENITNEILKKIDRNTNVLQSFLQKLITNIDSPVRRYTPEVEYKHKETTEATVSTTTGSVQSNFESLRTNLANQNTLPNYAYQQVPLLFDNSMFGNHRNGTMTIPFVYAYQRPIVMSNKEMPIASVVYQGHIHTNAFNERDFNPKPLTEKFKESAKPILDNKPVREENGFWKTNSKIVGKVFNNYMAKNNSKYFIDPSDDYKIVPIVEKKIYTQRELTVNTTNV